MRHTKNGLYLEFCRDFEWKFHMISYSVQDFSSIFVYIPNNSIVESWLAILRIAVHILAGCIAFCDCEQFPVTRVIIFKRKAKMYFNIPRRFNWSDLFSDAI